MHYELHPLTHHGTGAEVRGIDLTKPVSDAVRKQLNEPPRLSWRLLGLSGNDFT
jgi:hypothetical protein